MNINTPGSQQHLTNLGNYLWGHFYMAFLLLRGRRELGERKGNLMKGYGHEMPYSYLHTLPVLCFSQSHMEEAPVSVSQPSPPPLFHCSFIPRSLQLLSVDPQEFLHKSRCFFVKQLTERERTRRDMELTGGPKPGWLDFAPSTKR